MKIKERLDQHRRDFTAVYECEHCGATKTMGGYDDANFHKNVIPQFTCDKCGEKAPQNYRGLQPKYGAHEVI